MSEIRVNRVVAAEGTSAPTLPYGFQIPTGMGITGAGGVNVTGVVTATSFSGSGAALTGIAVTENVRTNTVTVSGVSTFTGNIDANGDIDVDGTANLDVIDVDGTANFAAVVTVADSTSSTSTTTGALVVTGGAGIGGDVYIGAGLSVAGTLTYEDVTNVDSVGLITAKSGVNISGGQLVVGAGFSVGAAGVGTFAGNLVVNGDIDLEGGIDVNGTMEADAITVNGSTLASVIEGTTVTNSTHILVTDNESTNEDNLITFVEGATSSTGQVGLEMDGNLTYNPSTGRLTATQLSGTLQTAAQTNITSLGTLTGLTVSGDLSFDNGADAGKDLLWDVSQDALIFSDTVYASFGSDQDMSIWHDGSNCYIQNTTGTLNIRPKSGENAIVCTADADVKIYYDNSQKLITTNDGVNITGIMTASSLVEDSLGNVRTIAQNNVSSQQTLASTDAGRVMKSTSGGLIINTSNGFGLGQAFTFINDSGSDMTITQTGTTLYLTSDGSTGNKTISGRGMATGVCVASNTFYLTGNLAAA